MSDDDRLPEGDDPFVLLGVPPGSDAREIKRAYVRLIRRFRPERAPEEFKRIVAAYEAALLHGEMMGVARDDEEEAAGPVAPLPIVPPPARTRAPGALPPEFEPMSPDRAAPGAATDGGREPEPDPQPELQPTPRAPTESERRAIAVATEIGDLLGRDHVLAALARLADPEVQSLARREPVLEEAAVRALCAGLLTADPQVARALFEQMVGREGDHVDLWFELNQLTLAWKIFVAIPRPPLLIRVLRTARVVAPPVRDHLVHELYEDIRRDPDRYLPAFDQLTRAGPEMVAHVAACMGGGFVHDLPVDAFPAPTRDRVIETLRRVDQGLGHLPEVWRFWIGVGLLGATVVLAGIFVDGRLTGSAALGFGIYYLWTQVQDRVYRRRIRPQLVQLALEYGISNHHLAYWLESRPGRYPRLARRAEQIGADAGLYQLAAIRASVRLEDDLRAIDEDVSRGPRHDLPEIDPRAPQPPKTAEDVARENRELWRFVAGVILLFAAGVALLFLILRP